MARAKILLRESNCSFRPVRNQDDRRLRRREPLRERRAAAIHPVEQVRQARSAATCGVIGYLDASIVELPLERVLKARGGPV
jgi:hypothetical protein